MKIAIIGYGTMGRLIHSLAEEKGHTVSSIVRGPSELPAGLLGVDAAIDFSVAGAVRGNVEACLTAGVPLVEGTTGWNSEIDVVRSLVGSNNGSFVYGANFSIGVNVLYRIAEFAAELFAKFPEYEVFIEEQHHSRKKDEPSGTALKLKDIVSRHYEQEFSVAATRAGNIPGTHRVGFDGPADQIVIEHTARSREGFAAGALLAADWIAGKRGFYEFGEVMNEIIGDRI